MYALEVREGLLQLFEFCELFHLVQITDVEVLDGVQAAQTVRVVLGETQQLLGGHYHRLAGRVVSERQSERHKLISFNMLRTEKNGQYFADVIFQMLFLESKL